MRVFRVSFLDLHTMSSWFLFIHKKLIVILDQNGAIEKVKSYTEVLKKYFDINAVFLYGSYASGKQREHSDIDVAVRCKFDW